MNPSRITLTLSLLLSTCPAIPDDSVPVTSQVPTAVPGAGLKRMVREGFFGSLCRCQEPGLTAATVKDERGELEQRLPAHLDKRCVVARQRSTLVS